MTPATKAAPTFGIVLGALVIVYVVWGSTYLAIRIVVEEAPPLTSMGLRYGTAGVLLGAVLTVRGGIRRLRITGRQALGAGFLGLMLPVLGNGMVSVAENLGAPSGVTALLIAIAPLIIVVFRLAAGDRPRALTLLGVLAGFVGLAGLVLAGSSARGRLPARCRPAGAVRRRPAGPSAPSCSRGCSLPEDVFVTTVYEMLFGGADAGRARAAGR